MPGFHLFVCLSVCLLQLYAKTTKKIFMKILPRTVVPRKKLLDFRRHPLLDSDPGIFLKDSSTLRERAVSAIWLISMHKLTGSS